MKKSDRDMLERAARAAGLDFDPTEHPRYGLFVVDRLTADCQSDTVLWNPLHPNTGDALKLAAKLRIPVWFDGETAVIADQRECGQAGYRVEIGVDDLYGVKAMCRAITWAAAER